MRSLLLFLNKAVPEKVASHQKKLTRWHIHRNNKPFKSKLIKKLIG